MPRRRAQLLALALCPLTSADEPPLVKTVVSTLDDPPPSSSPLIKAIIDNDAKLALRLITDGVDVNAYDVITPLYAAQEYVHNTRTRHKLVDRLLRAGARADTPTRDGSTPLMLAAEQGDVRSSDMLLARGADPLRTNEGGYSAIGAAFFSGHNELARMLQEHVGEEKLQRIRDEADQDSSLGDGDRDGHGIGATEQMPGAEREPARDEL